MQGLVDMGTSWRGLSAAQTLARGPLAGSDSGSFPAHCRYASGHSKSNEPGRLPEALNRDRRGDGRAGIVALRHDPHAEDRARQIAPIIFDGGCEADVP